MQIYHIIKILRRNKKMAVNKVDYEVLTSGVSVYSNQAGALDDVIFSADEWSVAGWLDKPDCRRIH